MVRMCTSSGPSNSRIARCQLYSRASGKSSDTPAAPCTWIARSMTSHATCGATALIWDTRTWASLLPCASMVHAAFSHNSRAWSISLRERAICSRTTPCSLNGLPNATRLPTRSTISANARSAAPSARMQWWMRAEPRLGDREPRALLAEQVLHGHPHVVVDDLAVPVLVLPAEHGRGAKDGDPWCIYGRQHHRLLLMAGRVGVGAAHHNQDLAARIRRPGRPPLAAVDHVVTAVAGDQRFDVAGVAGGHRRLGHREPAADLAIEQRLQPQCALGFGGEQVQGLHVAGVRCGAVGDLGCDLQAPPGQLRKGRVLQVRQP